MTEETYHETVARNVARFGASASSGEHAWWLGIPKLARALETLMSLDGGNKNLVVQIVQDWADNHNTVLVREIEDKMAKAYQDECITTLAIPIKGEEE
jgi:hypothetical protein